MPDLSFQNRPVSSFKELVRSFPRDEFNSPARSTVPHLDYWRSLERKANEFTALLGEPHSSQFDLHFEYRVPVQAGRGKPSHTDLMLLSSELAVAIEAKFTEPPYEKISSWLRKPPEANREQVLSGWLGLINRQCGVSLTQDQVFDLPYQLVHRTASACAASRPHCRVVYQIFDPEKQPYYESILSELAKLLRPGSPGFSVVLSPFEPTPRYLRLLSDWGAGVPDLAESVATALVSGQLLRFSPSVHRAVA
jgi:hypothetical protein